MSSTADLHVGLLTGGDDRSYALGLTSSLVAQGVQVDFIGSDNLDAPELHRTPLVTFLNLRGDQREDVGFVRKGVRLSAYYLRLLKYAVVAKPRIFHILWNNKFELFDRTLLMLYYRLLGRRVVLTAHNVNAARRDGRDSVLNRLTLWVQYRLSDHIFVHTRTMKEELQAKFEVPECNVSVIPFGINNTAPNTALTREEAKQRLGLCDSEVATLFFGQIAPYKGLEYLVSALPEIVRDDARFRLVIAGKVKRGCEQYWDRVRRALAVDGVGERTILRIERIPDEELEVYFKAADVLVIPYTQIFQSGVPFLAYSFGVPVIAADVGSLREDIVEGRTGFICRARDPSDIARALQVYRSSEMCRNPEAARAEIRKFANDRYSWTRVGVITEAVYRRVLGAV